jgi:hypothetical protein
MLTAKTDTITRAGIRRRIGICRNSFRGKGSECGLLPPRIRLITLFCMMTCSHWVATVGKALRRWMPLRSLLCGIPSRSLAPRILAVATASWTARLIPTPPIGDMACAASPMHNSPQRDHRRKRSTATVSSLMSSQSPSSSTRSRRKGTSPQCLPEIMQFPFCGSQDSKKLFSILGSDDAKKAGVHAKRKTWGWRQVPADLLRLQKPMLFQPPGNPRR